MEEEIAAALEAPSEYADRISKDVYVCLIFSTWGQDTTELYEDDPLERAAHLAYQKKITMAFFYFAALVSLLGGIIMSLGLTGHDTGTVEYCDYNGECHSVEANPTGTHTVGKMIGASLAISLLCGLFGYFAEGIFFLTPPEPLLDNDIILLRMEKLQPNQSCCPVEEHPPVRRRYHLPRMVLDESATVCTAAELAQIVWRILDPISDFLFQDDGYFSFGQSSSASLQAKQAKMDQAAAKDFPDLSFQIQRVRVKEQKTQWQYTITITRRGRASKRNSSGDQNPNRNQTLIGGFIRGVAQHMNRLSDEVELNREEGIALVHT
jgi:hypothetical protein